MSDKKGERRAYPARLPIKSFEQLEEMSRQTGKALNDLLIEAVDLFLNQRRGELTPELDIKCEAPEIRCNPDLISSAPNLISLDLKLEPHLRSGDIKCPQPEIRLEIQPTQEEALARAQLLLEEKRSLATSTSAPVPINQVLGPTKRGLFRRIQCSEDGCEQGAARTIDSKNYCANCASLKEYAALPKEPSLPPVSTVSLPDCDICQNRRFNIMQCDGALSAHRCMGCIIDCNECKAGLVFWKDNQGYEKWLPCGCRKAPIDRQLRAVEAAEFPAAFASLLFGKLPPSDLSESQKNAHLLSWEWARNFTAKEKGGFFFHGSPGTGKTLSLCRAMALLIQRESSLRVRYLHFPAWLDLKKGSFGPGQDPMECASELVAPEVLLVDEILLQGKSSAARSFTEWERGQFDLMVHNRWLAGKPTLYATNYKPEQVENEVSESTWSRIRSTALFFEVSGKDMRLANNVLPFRPRGER